MTRRYLQFERADTRGYWLLLFFVIACWVSSIHQVLPQVMPVGVARVIGVGVLPVYAVLLLASLRAVRGITNFSRNTSAYLTLCLTYIGWLSLYGMLRGQSLRVQFFDLCALTPLFGGMLLGRRDDVWRWLSPAVCIMTAVSVFMTIANTDPRILIDRSIGANELGTLFEASLSLAPLLAIVASGDKRGRMRMPLLLVSCGVCGAYLYLGRRGVSVYAVLQVVAAVILTARNRILSKRTVIYSAIVCLFALGMFLYFPFTLLQHRYQGRHGVVDTLTVDNERLAELGDMIGEFSPIDLLFGRGLGGAFMVDRSEFGYMLDRIDDEHAGRIGTHAGLGWPLLKGGVLFCALYLWPIWRLFPGIFKLKKLDPITRGAVIAAPLWLCFQFVDGAINPSQPLVGFGIGLLASRMDRIDLTALPAGFVLRKPALRSHDRDGRLARQESAR